MEEKFEEAYRIIGGNYESAKSFYSAVSENEWEARGGVKILFEYFKDNTTHTGKTFEKKVVGGTYGCEFKIESEKSYDAILSDSLCETKNLIGNRVEIKYIKALHDKKISDDVLLRAKYKTSEDTIHHKGSWQQIKLAQADYGLFAVIYANTIDYFWIPYSKIDGKLSKQHLGNVTEGQLSNTKEIYKKFFLVSLPFDFIPSLFDYHLEP